MSSRALTFEVFPCGKAHLDTICEGGINLEKLRIPSSDNAYRVAVEESSHEPPNGATPPADEDAVRFDNLSGVWRRQRLHVVDTDRLIRLIVAVIWAVGYVVTLVMDGDLTFAKYMALTSGPIVGYLIGRAHQGKPP